MGPGPEQDGLSPGGESVGSSVNVKRDARAVSPDAAAASPVDATADAKKRRRTGPGSRGVANLTPDQLAKKRANDREAQRAIRERTKNQIETLERRIHELTNQKPYQELQAVIRAKEAVEQENADIKRRLASIIGMIQPLIGSNIEQAYISPVQAYTPSVTTQTLAPGGAGVNYHASTPTNSVSPIAGLEQQQPTSQQSQQSQQNQQSWPVDSSRSGQQIQQPTGGSNGIEDQTRLHLSQQQHSLRHSLDLGSNERLDVQFLLGPSQSHRVPRMQKGINGAQDTLEYRHVPMKHDWSSINHEQTAALHTKSSAWDSSARTQGASIPAVVHRAESSATQHGQDSSAAPSVTSPAYSRSYTNNQFGRSHSANPGPSPSPGMDTFDTDVEVEAGARYSAPVRNSDPTCPLDSLLLDFLSERHQRVAEGLPMHEVVGPRYPSVSSLLNPANSAYSHPVSKFFTDILATFPDISKLPERVAVLYVMFLVMRWQVSPTRENYELLPPWITPLPLQLAEPHPAWIDHLPFPQMREKLTRFWNPTDYAFDNFFVPFTTTLSLSWPYEETDTLLQSPDSDELMINPVFERHLRNLDNWKLGDAFAKAFPSLIGTFNFYSSSISKAEKRNSVGSNHSR